MLKLSGLLDFGSGDQKDYKALDGSGDLGLHSSWVGCILAGGPESAGLLWA
jgi:hypothetical protein